MKDYSQTSPQEIWKLIRSGEIDYPTAGMCAGYAQANLVILPKQYAEDFSPTENESLMLIGNAGLGKTHAALAIAGLVLEQGHDVIYVSSPDFFGKIEASRFDPSGDADTLLRTASTADLLILDDLGTEFVTPYFITVFYSLLNNRLGAGLPTIITTNITDGALLEKRYTEKISSRLSAFIPFRFLGEDIRPQKAAE